MDPHARPPVRQLRPPIALFLAPWVAGAAFMFAALVNFTSDPWGGALYLCVVCLGVGLPIEYRRQTVRLTSDGLEAMTMLLRRRAIPWSAIQGLTTERRRLSPAICVCYRFPDTREGALRRDRLFLGRGVPFARRFQEEARTEIEQWWIEYRGVAPRPAEPPVRLTFPPGVNPYAPPTRD